MNNLQNCRKCEEPRTEGLIAANARYRELYCISKEQIIADVKNCSKWVDSHGGHRPFPNKNHYGMHHHMSEYCDGKVADDTN
jgi:hypothetical protein